MIIFDHRQTGFSHLKVNALMIYKLSHEYSSEIIHVFLENDYSKNVQRFYEDNNYSLENVEFHTFELPCDISKREYYRLYDISLIKSIIKYAVDNNETKIVSLFTTVFQLYALKFYAFKYNKISFLSVIHGELENTIVPFSVNDITKWLYHSLFGIKIPLLFPTPKNMKYLVLGESIKTSFTERYPSFEDKMLAVDHGSFYYHDDNERLKDTVCFGIIGQINLYKNGNNLLKLCEKIEELNIKNFEFLFIGHIRTKGLLEKLKQYTFVKIYTDEFSFLTEEKFKALMGDVDYCLYTYNENMYTMIASGAFWDAIGFYKPIVTLKNQYFEYYFNKYGNIGYLADNISDLANEIKNLTESKNMETYYAQIKNIKQIEKNVLSYRFFDNFN